MDEIKVMFLSWHFDTPEIFLDSIVKMTPGSKGVWKNMRAVTDPNEADYYIIMDGWTGHLPNRATKAIYFGQHPNTPYSPIDKVFPGESGLLKFPLKSYLNPGEWWIEYTYDELTAMGPIKKGKDLACVATYQTHHPMYQQRQNFLRELVTKQPTLNIDLYGRPQEKYEGDEILKPYYKGVLGNNTYDAKKGEHLIGKNLIANYKHMLEFDVGPCVNYFSERFYDSILLWCSPIYFGCTNVPNYLPNVDKAFYLFNQNNLEDTEKVLDVVSGLNYNIEALAEVRNLLLNKYQTWAYAHHVVNNIEGYKTDPEKTFKDWINDKTIS